MNFQAALLERSLYDVIHPLDIYKIKEQISCAEVNPRHQLGTSSEYTEILLSII